MAHYSDEIINAFVDGELGGSEKEKFKQDIKDNKQLADKIQTLCELKQSLKSSYSQVSLPDSYSEKYSSSYNIKSVAFSILILCTGFFLGTCLDVAHINDNYSEKNEMQGIKLTPVNLHKPNKIILHISSSEPEALYKTLHKIDTILETYNENKMPFKLEVVANSGGIDLFRNDVSPYKKRIKQIIGNYSNVSFIACTNAIERLRLKGIEPDLIAETKTGVTAIEQIVKRLQDGWVYLKV